MPHQATDSLPRSADFLQQIFDSLNSSSAGSDHIQARAAVAKPQLLTLHALFPNSFLPALDLLDRGFVLRLLIDNRVDPSESAVTLARAVPNGLGELQGGNEAATTAPLETSDLHNTDLLERPHPTGLLRKVYYVQSQQYPAGRGRRATSRLDIQSYEVRLQAWNCTCAAFAFATFNTLNDTSISYNYGNDDEQQYSHSEGEVEHPLQGRSMQAPSWGGLASNGESVPVCKHLLACVLCENWYVAADMVDERVVGKAEAAGWAAGWGPSGPLRDQ